MMRALAIALALAAPFLQAPAFASGESAHSKQKDQHAAEAKAPAPEVQPLAPELSRVRAVTRQFDKLAVRDASSSIDLKQARDEYGKLVQDLAGQERRSGEKRDELRKHAEILVLSGGDVSVLAPWQEGLPSGSAEKKLFDGVTAYGMGRAAEAEQKLLSLDARTFDALRGGHLALTQALLASRVNPEGAFQHFDTARLLLPGTLVEEAALRQIAVLAARTGKKERFADAATSYLSRFRRSAYIAGFETQLAFHIARFPAQDGDFILREILKARPKGWGRCLPCFLAAISEQAIHLGKTDLASAAALAAMTGISDSASENQRLRLYHGAALIVTKDFVRGLDVLNAINPEALPEKDRELLRAALALAAKLRATPMMLTSVKLKALGEQPKRNRDFPAGERVAEAKAALTTVDEMLKQGK
jgi:chemotaxis protein MotC